MSDRRKPTRFRKHIHRPGDGRGLRDVYLDGKLVQKVFFADTQRGIVDAYRYPLRLNKHRKQALSYRRRGNVRVQFRNPKLEAYWNAQ